MSAVKKCGSYRKNCLPLKKIDSVEQKDIQIDEVVSYLDKVIAETKPSE